MSADLVVDSSIALTWLFADELTSATAELLERLNAETGVVPDLWFLEIANVLSLAERRGRIPADRSAEFIIQLSKLDLEIDTECSKRAFTHLLPLCRSHQLTSYDAVYLDLAFRRSLPLATLDEALRRAAATLDIKLLGV